MKKISGIWLPDHEQHLVEWMLNDPRARVIAGKATYQYHKLEDSLEECRQFRVAVDVGAHVGLWSMHLLKRFAVLHAFEPLPEHRECFMVNVDCDSRTWVSGDPLSNADDAGHKVYLHPCALGASAGNVSLTTRPSSSGDTFVSGEGTTPMRTLDSFGLDQVDFVKIDFEGYEAQVVAGAIETLRRCRPCVIVEQKRKNLNRNFGVDGLPAVSLLLELGAKVVSSISGDYILKWPS